VIRRGPGQANFEEHPKGSGSYRVRARIEGKLKTIASKLSAAEAEEIANAYAVIRDEKVLAEGLTLSQFGLGYLDRREHEGSRNVRTERNSWKNHVTKDVLGALPIASIERRDILDWIDRRPRALQTRKNLLNMLRVALQEALDRGLLKSNPARDVRIKGTADDQDDLEGILTPPEQRSLLEAVPEASRPLVAFALTTGLRQAEQWWLKPKDLGNGFLTVRRSVGGKPPKNGKSRTIHLLAPAQRALSYAESNAEWVWPAPEGGRRQQGKAPAEWHDWVKAAGIDRRVRWHDLRHTCATALLAGWWGRKWSLDEVCQHLGHSSVKVTERYARKLADTHRLAVAATVFPESSPLMLIGIVKPAGKKGSRLRDLNSRPAVYENDSKTKGSVKLLGGVFPRGNVEGTPGAWSLALAAEALRPLAKTRGASSTRNRGAR
jgi:integrase